MLLTETQEQVREAARAFASERLKPGAAKRDEDGAFSKTELIELGKLGFLSMLLPDEYGGSDVGMVSRHA